MVSCVWLRSLLEPELDRIAWRILDPAATALDSMSKFCNILGSTITKSGSGFRSGNNKSWIWMFLIRQHPGLEPGPVMVMDPFRLLSLPPLISPTNLFLSPSVQSSEILDGHAGKDGTQQNLFLLSPLGLSVKLFEVKIKPKIITHR